jgi:hypothetical protein
MKIRRNQLCPIHRSRSCCGREPIRKGKILQVGVHRIEDPHHPRGYRELRSPAEGRKLLNRKIVEDRICAICHCEFTDYNDVVPIMKIRRDWEEHGTTITQVTSGPSTGGAILKRDQRGRTSDGRSADGFRVAENNRPICLIQTYKACSRNGLFSCGDCIARRRSSASGSDLGRSTSVAEPHRLRFSLSHFPRRRTSLKLIGRRTATRSQGDALYVNGSQSSATDGAASRRTISIMIGLRSIAVAVPLAGRPSLFYPCVLSRIRITACWRVVMRCGADL